MKKKIILILIILFGISSTFGQQTDCSLKDGTFSFYARLIIDNIPDSFNKTDFINHITELDNISNEDLSVLNEKITSVFKSFPTAETESLQRTINISATFDIYPILTKLNNSIEFHECTGEAEILGTNNNEIKKIIVYPNPITENSMIELKMESNELKLEITNNLGQLIYQKRFLKKNIIELKNINLESGIYFLKVLDLENGNFERMKILKK